MKLLQRMSERARLASNKSRRPLDAELPDLIARYQALSKINARPHDPFIKICIEQALIAANKGSFAVGSVIVDRKQRVLQRAPAMVLQPHLRTDQHAEMLAMTRLEERHKFKCRQTLNAKLRGSILFTSLEPCPMCFTRWILSGVDKVFYATVEPKSGMAECADKLPSIWGQLIAERGKSFGPADCSPELSAFCLELFISSQKAGGGKQWQWK